MVKVSYHAEQQMSRLSLKERNDLMRLLGGGASRTAKKADSSGRYVSRFGQNKRVVWSTDKSGDVVVLTVVSKESPDNTAQADQI